MHRAVIGLGLLLAAFGALLGALGSSPIAAGSIVIAGALAVVAGLWLRRRQTPSQAHAVEPPVEPPEPAVVPTVPRAVPAVLAVPADAEREEPSSAPTRSIPVAPALPREERERQERHALREAELAREAELDAIADGLRGLRSRDLSSTHIPEWKARIETWIEADLKARVELGDEVPAQAAEWMRDFGDIPQKDWRRHMLRHLRRLGYRKYHEGEW